MPLYMYKCSTCGISIEKLESFDAEQIQICSSCGTIDGLNRQISGSSFSLSGTGWYKDSYSKK